MMDETYLMEHIKDQLCFVSQVRERPLLLTCAWKFFRSYLGLGLPPGAFEDPAVCSGSQVRATEAPALCACLKVLRAISGCVRARPLLRGLKSILRALGGPILAEGSAEIRCLKCPVLGTCALLQSRGEAVTSNPHGLDLMSSRTCVRT